MWDIAFSIPIPNLTGLFCGWWLGAVSIVAIALITTRRTGRKNIKERIRPLTGRKGAALNRQAEDLGDTALPLTEPETDAKGDISVSISSLRVKQGDEWTEVI